MSEDHTAEREAFEAWYSAEDQETDDPERTYELTEEGMNELTKYCVWQGWQARAAAQAQPSAVESNTAGAAIAAGAVYAELPMQFACSGVFPVYSADQMRAFADGTHALRTKSEASREFLERMLSAMEGVIDVADRKTAEFDALRSCVVDLTLMLFKPEALRSSRGKAPAQQPAPSAAPAVVSEREFKQFLSDVKIGRASCRERV